MIYGKLKKYAPEKLVFAYIGILLAIVSAAFSVLSYKYIYEFLLAIIVDRQIEAVVPTAWRIILFLVISTVVYFFSVLATHVLAFRLETNLKIEGIRRLAKASFSFFDQNDSGSIRKAIDDNTVMTHMSVAHLIPDLSTAVFVPVFGVTLAFLIDWRLGVFLLIMIAAGLIMMKKMMGERQFMEEYMKAAERMNAGAVEYVRGINVLKIFRTDVEALREFYHSIVSYADLALRYSMSCRGWYVAFQVIFNGAFLVVMFLPYFSDGDPMTAFAKFIFYVVFNGILFIAFMKVMYVGMYVFQANSSIGRIEELFGKMEENGKAFGSIERMDGCSVEFDDVSFGYDDKMIIEHLSFRLEEGKHYALVGPSGSGKTTLAKLISGFYGLNGGKILIGGHSLEEYTEAALASNIANVFQDAKLFKTTIYENVRIGDPKASREEIMQALHLAQCDEIIAKFRDRENTVIGAKGVHLSGGEVQRITIARAILKNARIVIMDEASAAADPENEYELQNALSNLMKNRTVIMIAHRLSSIRNVDEILVVDGGRITERGNHEHLMSSDTQYRRLQEAYMQANEWKVI